MVLGREYVDRHVGTIEMLPSELALLGALIANGGKLNRETMAHSMPQWKGKTADVMMSRVRAIIGKDKIITEYGTGWRLAGTT